MTFFLEVATIADTFLEIDLATIGPRHDCQHAMWPPEAQEFDTPDVKYICFKKLNLLYYRYFQTSIVIEFVKLSFDYVLCF